MSWLKQDSDHPLFEDLLWSKPENKQFAGKLLIVGGNLHSFSAPSQAFQVSQNAGAGSIRLILPISLKKTVGSMLPECEFGPINPSGSFSKQSLDLLIDNSGWADGTLLAGDFGRNSETAVLIEAFMQNTKGLVVLTKDAVDFVISSPESIKNRPDTTLVLTLDQLQKLTKELKSDIVFKYNTSTVEFAKNLEILSNKFAFTIVTEHLSHFWVAHNGKVSSTKNQNEKSELWRIPTASRVAVWQIQNPEKPFQSASTSLIAI